MEEEMQQDQPACLSHDVRWKSGFQCMINILRKQKIVDSSNAAKITTAVCTCCTHPTRNIPLVRDERWENITDAQYEEAEKYYEEFINSLSSRTDQADQYGLLDFHYRRLRNANQFQGSSSARRFVYIFQRLRSGNQEMLHRPRRQADPEEDRRERVTVHLKSLKPDQVPLFMGRQGHNMKRYLRGKKKVKVEMKTDGDDVRAIVLCRAQDREAIESTLTREADMLAERRRIHQRTVEEYEREQQNMDTGDGDGDDDQTEAME